MRPLLPREGVVEGVVAEPQTCHHLLPHLGSCWCVQVAGWGGFVAAKGRGARSRPPCSCPCYCCCLGPCWEWGCPGRAPELVTRPKPPTSCGA